jgi:hypothetical protein
VDPCAKKSEHLKLKATVVGLSNNLPEPNEEDCDADVRFKDSLNRREIESAKKAEKKRKNRRYKKLR